MLALLSPALPSTAAEGREKTINERMNKFDTAPPSLLQADCAFPTHEPALPERGLQAAATRDRLNARQRAKAGVPTRFMAPMRDKSFVSNVPPARHERGETILMCSFR